MKYLRLLLCLTAVAFVANIARADSFDSDTATIQKATDKTAKVLLDKKTYTVPITFDDGADWSSVKDYYELSDAAASAIKSGNASSISIGTDGGVTTHLKAAKKSK